MSTLTTELQQLSSKAQAEFHQLQKELIALREDRNMLEYLVPCEPGELQELQQVLGASLLAYAKDPRYLEDHQNEVQGEAMYDLWLRFNRVGAYCQQRAKE